MIRANANRAALMRGFCYPISISMGWPIVAADTFALHVVLLRVVLVRAEKHCAQGDFRR